jgi:hypothetical protein
MRKHPTMFFFGATCVLNLLSRLFMLKYTGKCKSMYPLSEELTHCRILLG